MELPEISWQTRVTLHLAEEAGKCTCLVRHSVTSNNTRKTGHQEDLSCRGTEVPRWYWLSCPSLQAPSWPGLHVLALTSRARFPGAGSQGTLPNTWNQPTTTLLVSIPISLSFLHLLQPQAQSLVTPEPLTLFHTDFRRERITLPVCNRIFFFFFFFLLFRG